MGPFEMVAIIVVAISIAGVLKAKYQAKENSTASSQDLVQYKQEIEQLKERVANLEKIVTDSNYNLKSEIENLK